MPFFSVIIPTFNRAEPLTRTVDSVLSQSFKDFELIIIDDGSTDNTKQVLSSYSGKLQYHHQENKGICSARNAGALMASGAFLIFLDSDDIVDPSWLQDFHEAIMRSGCDMAFCEMKVVSASGASKIVSPRQSREKEKNYGVYIPGSFTLKRSLFLDAGMYDEMIGYGENTELSYRIKKRNIKMCFIDRPNFIYFPSQDGESKNLKKRVESNIYILGKHKDFFVDHPLTKQQYLQTTGVSLVKLGKIAEARKFFWQGYLAHPQQLRSLMRVFISLLPPVAKRVWH